ncbi:hypothetical protein, partial [Streptococcus pneumoniae]|uniref:hypothetical protein n=1 Tax=Streptococcus pneumoniae TaxID=1313 RepID=UPI001152A577
AGGLAGAFSLLGSKVSLIVGGIKNLGLAIKALTFDKLVSFGETIYLNTLGESSQSFLKWVNDNANAMNMGVGEATNYGAVYSNLFSGFIKDTNKLSAYT